MSNSINLDPIHDYFAEKLEIHGTTPRGVDWNSETSQEKRFDELARIVIPNRPFSIIDFGSGFGSLYDYLTKKGHQLQYYGFDIVEEMVVEGQRLHHGAMNCTFVHVERELTPVDYVIASGIFNIKLDSSEKDWTDYVLETLSKMDKLAMKGFSFNLLTKYSDAEFMRPDLYYADPCFYFDYCKRNFARNVALLHDYGLYDFTILVRKQMD